MYILYTVEKGKHTQAMPLIVCFDMNAFACMTA